MSLVNKFWIWAIVNILTGIWEVYVYKNRDQLKLEKITLWEKMAKGHITIGNFWMEGWSEYCKVDSRYIYKQYVWNFELLNAILAPIFIIALVCKSYTILKIILGISIVNCVLYFISLIWEFYQPESVKDKNIVKENIQKYSKKWMLFIYYMISSIWIFVPLFLYINL